MLINENYQKLLKNAPIYFTNHIGISPKQHNLVTLQLKARAGAAADNIKPLADTELKS
jgi:hypothetical protein